jgi:hypothetical protein
MFTLSPNVTSAQLKRVKDQNGFTCLESGPFNPYDSSVFWRCKKRHKWSASFVDVQVNHCPKCFIAEQKGVPVLARNYQQVGDVLQGLRQVAHHFELNGTQGTRLQPKVLKNIYFVDLLFSAIHLETWIKLQEELDKADSHRVKWKKVIKKRCCGIQKSESLSFAEKLKALAKVCSKRVSDLKMSAPSALKLRREYRDCRDRVITIVEIRNHMAHGKASFPMSLGKLDSDMANFLSSLNSTRIKDFSDDIRLFMDLSDILMQLGKNQFKGNKQKAIQSKMAKVKVSKVQIQSLTGIW